MINLKDISLEQLKKVAGIKEKIALLEKQLQTLLGGANTRNGQSKKGVISAAGRARISAASKARWAKIKGSQGKRRASASPGKRTVSAATRAKLRAASKLRWDKVKAAKES